MKVKAITLSEKSRKSLRDMMRRTGAKSESEVLVSAYQFYKMMLEEQEGGKKIYLVKHSWFGETEARELNWLGGGNGRR